MLSLMSDLPPDVIGIIANGKVTADDYIETLFPAFEAYAEKNRKMKYLLLLDTSVSNFTLEAWLNDGVLGYQYLMRWSKVAIVTDQEGVIGFTYVFGKIMPGEFKGFSRAALQQAKEWVSAP